MVIYGIHIRALSVKIQENTNKRRILQNKAVTIKSLELRHVSSLHASSSGSVHQYLYKT
jgi:hypothetical protein